MVLVSVGLLFFSGLCLVILTGCPGPGDRFIPHETTSVSKQGKNVCFNIKDAQDYQPVDIGINPRGIPLKEKDFNFSPELTIVDGKLCIPPSFYHFPDNGRFIVEYILISKKHDEPRKFVVGVGINHGVVYNFPLTDREIARPYGSIKVSE
ncbi:putative T6SS immunity periplasmic lipoprotein [Enterobacter hormaechei]|uniref:putative T6SS immunity periplasmic lipoprotein n=1 Tax=Enterobacter hormaechei TaxID=158836 RepID=UPI0021ADE7D7|nr:putative T6SS immunity periplasmic lipoprotein [Enterobacter hormaechei]